MCLNVCNVLSSCEWTQARIYEPVTKKGGLSKENDITMNEREEKRRKRREEKRKVARRRGREGGVDIIMIVFQLLEFLVPLFINSLVVL